MPLYTPPILFLKNMFTGEYNHTIDQKGRIIIPNKFRNLLGDSFVVTRGVDECLEIYDKENWSEFENKINALPYSNPVAREFKRIFLGLKEDYTPDKLGRIQLTIAQRDAINFKQDITFVGVGNHIELWDADTYKKKNTITDLDDLSKKMEGLGI